MATIDEVFPENLMVMYTTYEDYPEPGEYVSWPHVEPLQRGYGPGRTREDANMVRIPSSCWSSTGGDSVNESNYRSVERDYGDHLVRLSSTYTDEWLIPLEGLDEDVLADLLDVVVWLQDYPLYDEHDHSELELEWVDESWGQYMESDVRNALTSYAKENWGQEYADALEDSLDEHVDSGKLREMFFKLREECNSPWECDGSGIIFPDWEAETIPRLHGVVSKHLLSITPVAAV